MRRMNCLLLAITGILLLTSSALAIPFQLTMSTDHKISTSIFSPLADDYHFLYSLVTGEERDELREGIDAGSIYYLGFDLNLDHLFGYSDVATYQELTEQKYTIETLNVEIKLKDDHYSVLGIDAGDDLPHEFGRVDFQLWTDASLGFFKSWPNSVAGFNEVDDPTILFSYDFTTTPLDYTDWFNHGEVIVTTGYPEILANSDFIVDRVKIWGERSLFTPSDPDPIPEPSAILLFGSGLLAIALILRKKP